MAKKGFMWSTQEIWDKGLFCFSLKGRISIIVVEIRTLDSNAKKIISCHKFWLALFFFNIVLHLKVNLFLLFQKCNVYLFLCISSSGLLTFLICDFCFGVIPFWRFVGYTLHTLILVYSIIHLKNTQLN